MKLRIFFAISVMILLVSMLTIIFLSPEIAVKLTKLSWIPDELDPEQLEKAKELVTHCDISESELNRINTVLFDAEKEFYLNNDTIKAEKLFVTVKDDIVSCVLKTEHGELFLDTILGKITQTVAIISGITSTVIAILGYKKHGKNFL